jgi:hypothetical protein
MGREIESGQDKAGSFNFENMKIIENSLVYLAKYFLRDITIRPTSLELNLFDLAKWGISLVL